MYCWQVCILLVGLAIFSYCVPKKQLVECSERERERERIVINLCFILLINEILGLFVFIVSIVAAIAGFQLL